MHRPSGPRSQLAAAVMVMVGGAALIAWWVVGLVLLLAGLAWALTLDVVPDRRTGTHEDVIERWRRTR